MQQQLCVVLAVIKNSEGKFLIGKRHEPDIPEEDNKWELVGGKIDWDETPEQAVVREAKEESGLDVEVVRLLNKIYTTNFTDKHNNQAHVILISYECKIIAGEPKIFSDNDEVKELKFVDSTELDAYEFLPFVKEIIELASA
jgi:mutator protein MutT